MGISKQFLLQQAKRLETNYGKERFVMNPDIFGLWYEMFQDCEEEGLKLAVDRCLKESEFPPTIATLMKLYKELADEREELKRLIEHEYSLMKSVWDEKDSGETFNEIVRYLNKQPKKERRVKMVELSQEAISYYHDLVAKGIQNIPTILEYVKGKE